MREHELLTHFPGAATRALPVGDIWIGLSGETIAPGGVVLERKTIADLEASMSDGRYREQRTRLQAFAQETGCQVAYVLEGSLNSSHRFSKEILLKWLVRLPFVHRIPYFQTDSVEDTAAFVRLVASRWIENPTDFRHGKETAYVSTLKHTKGEQRDSPHIFLVSVLTCCKGVSANTAEALLRVRPTLAGLLAATEAELAAVTVSAKRRLGPALAKKLYGLLHATDTPVAAAPVATAAEETLLIV